MTDGYFQTHYYRLDYILNRIKSLGLNSSAKILDIGCYPPYLLRQLNNLGYDTYGISSVHEKIKDPKISIFNIETQKFPYLQNHFDLVIFSEVLEHLTADPAKIFAHIRQILKPKGCLLITTPNAVRLHHLIKIAFGKNIYFPLYQFKHSVYHRHHREYTADEIRTVLSKSKFEIKTLKNIVAYPPFRPKNQNDSIQLKIIKWLGFSLMLLIPSKRDTLFVLASKP